MDDFSYSLVRSFNQFLNANLSMGTDEQLVFKRSPKTDLDKDTVFVEFYDNRIDGIGGGRQVGGSRGRWSNDWAQIDVYSPPNTQGESREGAHRQLVDRVAQVFKGSMMVPLIQYGTAGTQEVRRIRVRQESGKRSDPGPEMEGWTRTTMSYRLRTVDTD